MSKFHFSYKWKGHDLPFSKWMCPRRREKVEDEPQGVSNYEPVQTSGQCYLAKPLCLSSMITRPSRDVYQSTRMGPQVKILLAKALPYLSCLSAVRFCLRCSDNQPRRRVGREGT